MGAPNDGGYVVSRQAVEQSDLLLSMGLNDDWAFEADYLRRSKGRIICLDHSVDGVFWAWYTLHGLVRFSAKRATRYLAYRSFFTRARAEHRRVKVGYDGTKSASLAALMMELKEDHIFLKVDIEGSEYRILDDIVRYSSRFTGVAIEFHDVDLHRDLIAGFLSRLEGFQVVSLHANNFGGADSEGDPLVIEVTLTREEFCPAAEDRRLGEALNTPNNPGIPDIAIRFDDEQPGQLPPPAPVLPALGSANQEVQRPSPSALVAPARQNVLNMRLKSLAKNVAVAGLRGLWSLGARGTGMRGRIITYEALRTKQPFILCGDRNNGMFIVSSKDSIIGRELFVKGEFDFEKFIQAFHLISANRSGWRPRLLIDVGANIGPICIHAVLREYVDQALALEPDPMNSRLLRVNLELNGLTSRIQLHEVAAAPNDGDELQLELSDYNLGDHRIVVANGKGVDPTDHRQTIMVNSARLDTVCAGVLDQDLLVWMDVQGYEGFALSGAQALLGRRVPLVLEFWPKAFNRTGGFPLMQAALAHYSGFFDLAAPDRFHPITEMEALAQRLGEEGSTDIVVL
jgi:FkbM family methyltransferase